MTTQYKAKPETEMKRTAILARIARLKYSISYTNNSLAFEYAVAKEEASKKIEADNNEILQLEKELATIPVIKKSESADVHEMLKKAGDESEKKGRKGRTPPKEEVEVEAESEGEEEDEDSESERVKKKIKASLNFLEREADIKKHKRVQSKRESDDEEEEEA